MRWMSHLQLAIAGGALLPTCEVLAVARVDASTLSEGSSSQELIGLRDEVVQAFRHAFGAYLIHAYPDDELMPLSCRGRRWDHRTRGTVDDALGGYALTMLDSLDMFAVIGDGLGFREAVETVLCDFQSGVLSFDRDVVVSVFEASIRVLGGLLSAHQIAAHLAPGGRLGPVGWYNGELLPLANDLGRRLLRAFDTPLGIPVHRVNLRKGIPRGETRHTCAAAAGTFLLEFGALSRLTGDPSFEAAARRAVGALWERRTSLSLVGSGIDGTSGKWDSDFAGIGAGTDSFYEYLLKSAVLYEDDDMSDMFLEAYAGVESHMVWRGWHVEVDMRKGKQMPPRNYRVSALQAFWPAVQAAAGDLAGARRTYDSLFELWEKYQALPDFYDVFTESLLHYGRDSPLRPELAESTLALYQHTRDSQYLTAGADLFRALESRSKVPCGYASLGDVRTGSLDDRMDSYFIAETLKYLFLLFDSALPPDEQTSIFCTPDEEGEAKAYLLAAVPLSTTAAGAATSNATVAPGNCSSTLTEEGKCESAIAEPSGVENEASVDQAGPDVTQRFPRCLLWSDTVLSTEGHPFIASALKHASASAFASASAESRTEGSTRQKSDHPASAADGQEKPPKPTHHVISKGKVEATSSRFDGKVSLLHRLASALRVRSKRAASDVSMFDPRYHFTPPLRGERSPGELFGAELEVECHTALGGWCNFYDAGPHFVGHLKQAVGDNWAVTLMKICNWVRDTAFASDVKSNAIEGESVTYRLRQLPSADLQ